MPAKSAAVLEPPVTAKRARFTADAIAAVDDRPEIELPVPEWGDAVVVIRGLTYDQLALAREKSWDPRMQKTNEDLLNAWCLALGLVEPAITWEVAKNWICERSFGAVNTVLTEILTASGLGKRAQDAAKSATQG